MDSNRILNQSHDAQTEIEHLTANLCEAGMEIFDLRAELVAALELSERWRTLAEYRLAQAERREGAAERRHASASDLVEIPEDWHHRAGVGRRWKDEPERRKASSERWRLFHRERRGVVTAEPGPPESSPSEANTKDSKAIAIWLAVAQTRRPGHRASLVVTAPDSEPPKWLAKALRPRRSHFARVAFAVLTLACVTALIVLGILWPSVGLAVLGGLGVGGLGAGLVWAAAKAGERSGHRRYAREQLTDAAGVAPIPRPTLAQRARGTVSTRGAVAR